MDFRYLLPFGRTMGLARPGEDPFAGVRRDMDRIFDSLSQAWPAAVPGPAASGFLAPKVDAVETDTGLELTADLPGVDPADIDLELADNVLTLKAEHKETKEEKDEKRHYHLVERVGGSFLRRFALPFEVQSDKVEASFDKGVLKIIVPRAAIPEKPARKISIKAA